MEGGEIHCSARKKRVGSKEENNAIHEMAVTAHLIEPGPDSSETGEQRDRKQKKKRGGGREKLVHPIQCTGCESVRSSDKT